MTKQSKLYFALGFFCVVLMIFLPTGCNGKESAKHICPTHLSMKDTIFIDMDLGYGGGWDHKDSISYTRNALITKEVDGALYITADTTKPIIAIKTHY